MQAYYIAILYSAPLTDPKQLSTREFLNCSAQEIIDDLNSKRKRDAALLEGNSSSCARDLKYEDTSTFSVYTVDVLFIYFQCEARCSELCLLYVDFKKTLDMHCTAAYNSMEAAVYNMYDRNNATIQDKLHELFEVLERTGKA